MVHRFILVALAIVTFSWAPPPAQGADFVQLYTRGKLLYRQRLFADAVKEFNKAIQLTAKGKTHFGVHYYLARAYFWRPDIQKAMATLNKARGFIKNKAQKRAFDKALRQIRTLYGKLTFVPEVDPDDVGRLQFVLKPKSAFSHKHKRRYYRILSKRLAKQGGLKPSSTIYLPKGEYVVGLKRNQCLRFGLFSNDRAVKEISVGDADVSLSVKGKRSCNCPGNMIIIKDPKNPKEKKCSCPPNTVWKKKAGECRQAEAPSPLPYILGIGFGVLGAGAAIGVIAYFVTLTPTDQRLGKGPLWTE